MGRLVLGWNMLIYFVIVNVFAIRNKVVVVLFLFWTRNSRILFTGIGLLRITRLNHEENTSIAFTGNLKWFDGGLLFGGFALLTVGELRRAGARLRSGQRSGSGSAFRDHSLAVLQSRGEDAEMKLNTNTLLLIKLLE